ncbi:alpha-ketoglutarate-dependent taurine dioxygenase [Bradyrhizobium sp. LB9.1b]
MSSLAGKQGPRYRHTADDGAPYETIAVEKLTPIIGAEISGVDIGKLVSDDARSNRQMDEIHRALAENLVIFFRDQRITPHSSISPSAASSASCISIPPRRMRMKTRR